MAASCSGFLDETDKDRFIPSTVDHYAALMLQEFNSESAVFAETQYMTDDVMEAPQLGSGLYSRPYVKPMYTWQKDIDMLETGSRTTNDRAWVSFYRQIAIMNYVIEEIDRAEGTQAERDYVKGEAYFNRAFCYFCLTNLYAEPYRDAQQARTTYGVPLRTDIGINPSYNKNMLDENYSRIEDDLTEARRLIEGSNITKSQYHPTTKACDLLISRVKLYKKEYSDAIGAATRVIEGASLQKLTSVSAGTPFITASNPEVIYSFSQMSGSLFQGAMAQAGMVVSDGLVDLFTAGDLRTALFFTTSTSTSGITSTYPRKAEAGYTSTGKANFRIAEAYLNRAEAYAYSDQTDKAREDMQTLLSNRYRSTSDFSVPTGREELISFIEQERRKELCFETQHRWFDLRRMDETRRPIIEHRFSVLNSANKVSRIETYTLLANDRNYTLSLPQAEKNNNPLIRDYERYDKFPEINDIVIIE